MTDERIERVEQAIRAAIGTMDRAWVETIGDESAGKSRMDDFAHVAADAALAALDAEPTLEDVLRVAVRPFPESGDRVVIGWHQNPGHPVAFYASVENGRGVGMKRGPTIDAAIREAVQHAKEQG